MKRISVVLLIGMFTSMLMSSCNNSQSSQTNDQNMSATAANNSSDSKLITNLVTAQYDEITLSKYALTKSTNQDIKNIAQMMVNDHTTFLDSLTALAAKKNITVGNKDSSQTNSQINTWSTKNEPDFDKAWFSSMISAHKDAVNTLQKAIDDTNTPTDTKNLLNATLPTVKKHLDMLNQSNDKLNNTKS
jgi:putative membrane protein